jgi:hypothetical protein
VLDCAQCRGDVRRVEAFEWRAHPRARAFRSPALALHRGRSRPRGEPGARSLSCREVPRSVPNSIESSRSAGARRARSSCAKSAEACARATISRR